MSGTPVRVKLWDPFLRGFHWLLAASVIIGWTLGQFGPSKMTLHFWLGYLSGALILFRVVWGLVGPPEARFIHFLSGPRAIIRYARGMFRREPSYWHGHNPMGAWSVIALLVLIALQVASGLVSDPDDYINVGPLASEVSAATRKLALRWHHIGSTLILIMVLLHVGIVLFYRYWKHEDLIRPMITGWKDVIRRD